MGSSLMINGYNSIRNVRAIELNPFVILMYRKKIEKMETMHTCRLT